MFTEEGRTSFFLYDLSQGVFNDYSSALDDLMSFLSVLLTQLNFEPSYLQFAINHFENNHSDRETEVPARLLVPFIILNGFN